jgi:phospholipase C
MPEWKRFVFSALLQICVVAMAGSGLAAAATAPTITFTASPTSIGANGSSTLSWTTKNATKVSISPGIGTVALSGTSVVKPTATTTYTLTATGAGGTKTATVKVTVTATTVAITATPTTVASGGATTLKVTVTNAYSVAITNNQNSTSIPISAAGGSTVVKPTVTTTYTATATGSKNSASASVTVTVSATTTAPTVSITASPATISSGQASTLTVTAANATGVTVTNNVDATTYTMGATGGSQAVSPKQTTTYTATATGAGGTSTAATTVTVNPTTTAPTVNITASPATISSGQASTLTVTAANATGVTVTDNVDATTYTMSATGGSQTVSPTQTTTYTATATGAGGTSTAATTVTVSSGNAQAIQHVVFLLQENRTFDTYFGMLNPYRINNGWNVGDDGKQYNVDGIDDKLSTITNVNDEGTVFPLFKTTSTCLDDMTSSWLESYGDVSRWDFSATRKILMDGYVHVAENYAKSGVGSGSFTDTVGQRAMAYYDEGFLNYYYYMASQFAVSDRWFSPVSSKSTPNRIATYTGGTTQGLVFDPFTNDHLSTLSVQTIFQELDAASPAVSWKIYYSLTQGTNLYPVTTFSDFGYSGKYLYSNASQAACAAPTIGSKQAVGDASNSFCVDPNHIASLSQFFTDTANGTLPSFAYIEAGYGHDDEHPGSGQSVLQGQSESATILNSFMNSPSWKNSVFFQSYDEGGGPYDHVPPVPGHTNDFTDASLGVTSDIASIAVNADSYGPCVPVGGVPTLHCDLVSVDPGAKSTDTAAINGFKAQLGFRLPNMIVSPFTRRHYVSHTPMDHTAVIKFVETRFIGPSASLTARDAAQPDLMEFFDFTAIPWSTPPTPPAPVTDPTGSKCTPASMGP